ncbi:hypothetical protein ONS95_001311 [Cadophora gregata]|uniref:uncharacterized protein n=1 Tax=Cadophora gregata TaxID=51156 RepID=UPI0026DA8A1B|nr:uncharacterized protein ONS95_001311 [Cadophora gregata]KAK0101877.1 hypothetical protein ONS96_005852 [Cadophora gregata f. sp. sojae]KAK0129385.1 hypothetical protein ONS95_001311 [Cadophora gregata]
MSVGTPGSLHSPGAAFNSVDIQKSVSEIFDLERDPRVPFGLVQGYQENDQTGPDQIAEKITAKIEYLTNILPILTHLWLSSSEHLDLSAEKLADACRETRWRVPVGESGVLDFFLGILPHCEDRRVLKLQILRLIGNTCADVDNNRAQILSRNVFPSIIRDLRDHILSPFAVVVIYNMCVDYEPAQREASEHQLTRELIEYLFAADDGRVEVFLDHCCELLGFMVTQEAEIDKAPSNTCLVLFNVAAALNIENKLEEFSKLLDIATCYLTHTKFRKGLIEDGGMVNALNLMTKTYMSLEKPESIIRRSHQAFPQDAIDRAVSSLSSLSQQILDTSSLPEFSIELYPLESQFGTTLIRLLSSSRVVFQNYACVLVGNLARSDTVSEELVHTYQIHNNLNTILRTTDDAKILFAALSLLNNLCVSPRNKVELGNSGLLEFLPTLWNLADKVAIQHASIRLTRSLLVSNWDNVRRFYRRLSRDKDSPAHMRSNMSLLLATFDRTDNETTKVEISRLITAFCRVGSQRMPKDSQKLEQNKRKFYYMHPEIKKPLIFMITQQKSAIVRSEGWFTLALLAGTAEGTECIFSVLSEDGGMQALMETIEGKRIVDGQPTTPGVPQWIDQFMGEGWDWGGSPQATMTSSEDAQAIRMANIDRKNARAILRVLINSGLDAVDSIQLSVYKDLLSSGSL